MTSSRTVTTSRWHTPLLAAHIVVAVGWLGAGLAVSVLTLAGLVGADPVTVYPAARRISAWLVAPLAAVTLATGLALATTSHWGLFAYRWVTAKLTISVLLAGIIAVLLLPRLTAVAAITIGPDPSTLTLPQRLPLALAPVAASVLLGVNVVLGIAKPGRHRRPRKARP